MVTGQSITSFSDVLVKNYRERIIQQLHDIPTLFELLYDKDYVAPKLTVVEKLRNKLWNIRFKVAQIIAPNGSWIEDDY